MVTLALLLMVGSASAEFDTFTECNNTYYDLEYDFFRLEDDFDDCEDDLDDCESDWDRKIERYKENRTSSVAEMNKWKSEFEKCEAYKGAAETIKDDKDKTIAAITSERDSLKNEVSNCNTQLTAASSSDKPEIMELKEKLAYLNDKVVDYRLEIGDLQSDLKQTSRDLNNTRMQIRGNCNEYLKHNFYRNWVKLSGSEQECLEEVMKRDRVAFATSDGKESIMLICDLSMTYAVRYLSTFQEYGFIEKDPSTSFKVDPDYQADAKKYMSMVGYFHPVDLPMGCVQSFKDLDEASVDGSNWGLFKGMFWFTLGIVVFVVVKKLIDRVEAAY